ncbi:hypothetical protein PDO_5351, partial [Rhizobium sp. PDO1-076]
MTSLSLEAGVSLEDCPQARHPARRAMQQPPLSRVVVVPVLL